MSWLLGYLALGAVAGFFAGLLGVGGGAVMAPVLAMMFAAQGFPEAWLMHLALGTSMTVIVFTSVSSLRAHHQRQAVRWPIVAALAPGILLGAFGGARLTSVVSTQALAIFFTCFMAWVAFQLLVNVKPKPSRQLPGRVGMTAVGGGIGLISALASIGGGTLSVPFMLWCNVRMHEAIGTSAAIGFPIALAGAAGYLLGGAGEEVLPSGSVGFVYLPALASCVAMSVLTAPLGARAAHALPVPVLKRIFAVLILILLGRMLYSIY